MATRARLTQDRSRLRREELLDAAIALFAEGGARGITHRAVASKAGLPPATTTYYFNSIDELIDEALSRHMGNWLRDLEALTATPVEADITVEDASGLISMIFAVRSTDIVSLQLRIYLAAALTPELRAKAAEALTALEDLATKMLHHVGIAHPADLARSVVAIIAGSAVSRVSELRTDEEEAALLYRAIRGLVVASLLNEDEIGERLQTLRKNGTASV